MRNQFTPLICALTLVVWLGACKKAESPAPAPAAVDTTTKETTPAAAVTAESKTAPAGQGILLKVKWPLGSRYVYRMDLEQHSTNRVPMMPKPIEQNVTMAMTYALSATKDLPDNGRELEMEFLANEMEIKMGDQVMLSFDSKETGKNDPQAALVAPFRKMIGSKIHVQIDGDGKVDKVPDLDQWQKTVTAGDAGPGGGMLGQQFNEGFFRQMLEYGRAFPDKPVKPGASWPFQTDIPAGPLGKIKIDATIKFKGMETRQEHNCAALDTKGTFNAADGGIEAGPMGKMTLENGKAKGTSWFDPELGALVESSSEQSMHLKGNMPGQPGGARPPVDFTIELAQKVNLNLVEIGKVKP